MVLCLFNVSTCGWLLSWCLCVVKRFAVVCEYEWSVVVMVLLLPFCVVLYCFVSRLHSFVRCIVVLVVGAFMLFCYFVVCVSVCVIVSTSA